MSILLFKASIILIYVGFVCGVCAGYKADPAEGVFTRFVVLPILGAIAAFVVCAALYLFGGGIYLLLYV